MSLLVCMKVDTLRYPQGGGHKWVFLNWALGLRAAGCRVIWLEGIHPGRQLDQTCALLDGLRSRLTRYGLGEAIAVHGAANERLPPAIAQEFLNLDAAAEADLLISFHYAMPPDLVACFRRAVLIDIDPGLLQLWISHDKMRLARYDAYFTTGETVGRPEALFPDCGLPWQYTPPCVALEHWPVRPADGDAPYSTVTHWWMEESVLHGDEVYRNDKRAGFLPFLDLPGAVEIPLELALCLGVDEAEEARDLKERGWRLRNAWQVSATPWDYQSYIQASRGEFSCVKPSCVRLQNAWISDRSLCYLASGKPVVVQHTGPSRLLPEREGILRFRTPAEAVAMLEDAEADYEHHCRAARRLVEQHFGASEVARVLVERALA